MHRLPLKLAALAGLGLLCSGVGYAPPASAAPQVSLGIGIELAPPPTRFERPPPARRGYVWAPGYWRWDARARGYVWARGYWVQARPGWHYHRADWVHGRHGWEFQPGGWRR